MDNAAETTSGKVDTERGRDNGGGAGDGRAGDGGHGRRRDGGDDNRGAVTPMPASIVKAICRVQATIEAVAKTQFNKQGNYKFASTDDIYAAVARKFGEAGLLIYPVEMQPPEIRRVEKTDKQSGQVVISQWGLFSFGYVLATDEATWFDSRSSRTIFLQILGPQTFNAAESYCQKQFLRSLLKLPTGDQDLDSLPQAETEDEQILLSRPQKRKSSAAAKRDGDDAVLNEIRGAISGADGPADLQRIKRQNWSTWEQMPSRWREILDAEFEDRMAELALQAAE